jgi:hypothetical protein
MSSPVVLRAGSSVFRDRRDGDRALRVTWHPLDDVFVFSTWRAERCASTFQIARSDVPDLVAALAYGLADGSAVWSSPRYNALRHDQGPMRMAQLIRQRLFQRRANHPR